MSDELTTRMATRSTVDYQTYVLSYGGRQRANVLLAVIGLNSIVAASIYLYGAWLVVALAVGLALLFAGGVAFVITGAAHATYTQHLAVSVSETWHTRPEPAAPAAATVRPFVASQNATNGRTTLAGALAFPPGVWRDLFNRALANGGVVTRDGAQAARVGRQWYHGEGWDALKAELTRLGFIDARNRLTPAALEWYAAAIPLPLEQLPHRAHPDRTNGRTNGTLSPDLVPVGEAGQ